MDTRRVKLIQGTVFEYLQLERFWGKKRRFKPNSALGRVVCTLTYDTYQDLFTDVMKTDRDCVLRVRDGRDFREYNRKDLDEHVIDELADIAQGDPNKKYYLELLVYNGSRRFSSLCFVEFEDHIVLNEVSIDRSMREDFHVEADDGLLYYNGLWVPYDHFRRTGERLPDDYRTNGPPAHLSNQRRQD